jgi:hypothetical protein
MKELSNNGHHAMRYAGLRSDYHEFLCDDCGRHVLLHANPSSAGEGEKTFVILKRGDFWATHSGGIGGLVINGVEVQKGYAVDDGGDQADLSDEWKGWLADIFDDAE